VDGRRLLDDAVHLERHVDVVLADEVLLRQAAALDDRRAQLEAERDLLVGLARRHLPEQLLELVLVDAAAQQPLLPRLPDEEERQLPALHDLRTPATRLLAGSAGVTV
jgi:hypothetical protein